MRSDFPVVFDACVLATYTVCDLFLRLAENPRLYLPNWSEEILAETRHTHVGTLNWKEPIADSFQRVLREQFPEAMVTGWEKYVPICQNDAKDRHVLAAAIERKAEVIVTFNLRHFPRAILEPFGVSAVHPAAYLITLYGLDSGVVVSKLGEMARKKDVPPERMLALLGRHVPAVAQHVANALGLELLPA